jgi:Flp pilus assembly protein TadG
MRRCDRWDEGMVTAEAAVALPAVALLIAGALAVVLAVDRRLSVVDAAHAGARVAARGETDAAVGAAVGRVLSGATSAVSRHDGLVTVTVSDRVDLPVVRELTIHESATALDETALLLP